ncbi:MAG: DNA primase [Flavipsychrobacter sp.]|nr:DNA primase [Flavipsychrobacter sp.]
MISPQSIQEVLSRADIIDIVGQFVRLKKRGASYIANCPFHNEKTPSFNVSAAKGIYKCFGCGKGGNVVTFIQDHEKLSYPESIRWLADYYKITLEESERTPEQQVQQLAEEGLRILNEYAAQYFHENLLHTEEGQNIGLSYFKQRGFRKDIIERFRLGYNSESGDSFYKAAIAKGQNAAMLDRAGLVKSRNDRFYDVYRGRVIFPIQSMTGRILGFGARILKSNEKAPKYINTPENELYVKSRVLYGMYQSRQAIGKLDECFLVEGYTDVISLHQGGVENVVSSSGTSLTEDQLRLIAQLTKNLTILYDGDAAGIKAALRGLDMALGQSFNVQLVLLPEGEDPDSYIQKSGAAQFHEYVKGHKKDVIGFRLEVGLKDAGDDPVKKSKLVNEIAESISRINKAEDFALQSHYIREASRKLDVDENGMVTLINKYIRDRIDKENKHYGKEKELPASIPEYQQEQEQAVAQATKDEEQEWQLIRILVEYGDKPFEGYVDAADFVYQTIDPDVIESDQARNIYKHYFDLSPIRPSASYFTNHQDTATQQRIVTLLQTNNEISPKWKLNYGIESQHGEMNYINDVESTIAYFELKKIIILQEQVATLLMKELDPLKQAVIQKQYFELRQLEKEIVKKHGTVVFKLLKK